MKNFMVLALALSCVATNARAALGQEIVATATNTQALHGSVQIQPETQHTSSHIVRIKKSNVVRHIPVAENGASLHDEHTFYTSVENERLVEAKEDLSIDLSGCRVHISKGAIVLICESGDFTAIYNLHERSSKTVWVEYEGAKQEIKLGNEFLISKSNSYLTDLLTRCAIPRRCVSFCKTNSDATAAVISEVQAAHILRQSKTFRSLSEKKNTYHAHLKKQLIKTAASVTVASSYKGPYHRFILGDKKAVFALTPEAIREMTTLAKHPSRGGFKGM